MADPELLNATCAVCGVSFWDPLGGTTFKGEVLRCGDCTLGGLSPVTSSEPVGGSTTVTAGQGGHPSPSGEPGGRGGTVNLDVTDDGTPGDFRDNALPHEDITFSVAGVDEPVLTIKGDGTILVNGNPVAQDVDAWHAFRFWLTHAVVNYPEPDDGTKAVNR